MSSSGGGRKGGCAARNTSAKAASAVRTARGDVVSDLPQAQCVVEAAETVSAQIDGHVRVADRPELAIDDTGKLRIECARHLLAPQFEPRNRVVMADAADAEPEIAEDRFGALDHAQLLVGDFAEIRDA